MEVESSYTIDNVKAKIQVKIGLLFRLQGNLTTKNSASRIAIFEGVNFVGRENIAKSDKRISRKHISIHGSRDGNVELVVEGPNPIVFKSGGQKKKLCSQERVYLDDGDILEFIPGNHSFEYVKFANEPQSSSVRDLSFLEELRYVNVKVLADESKYKVLHGAASTRIPQNSDCCNLLEVDHSVASKSSFSRTTSDTYMVSSKSMEAISQLDDSDHIVPHVFRLMRVKGLPEWANKSAVSIHDVIEGNILVAILSNYMVDIDWLKTACPKLWEIPHVLVIHGESGLRANYLEKAKPVNWILHKPALPLSYGTHHSKAMVLVYPTGVRIIVHTANLIHVDWNNKTQGLWLQDFPLKDVMSFADSSAFERDLLEYLYALKMPDLIVNLPDLGNVKICASFFKKFDYSSAVVRLIASVPGYHSGSSIKKWGHMKVRTVLEECVFDKEFYKSPLVYQFSSLGSLDEKWMSEFGASMSSGISDDKSQLGFGKPLIIWPTVEDVRCSLEGYAAGSAIPSPRNNVEKDFLKKYWARWKADHLGRCQAMPHIKSYARYNEQNLAWFLLTSANLSKAAWGALQKNNIQLMIRSYELGVLFLPSAMNVNAPWFSCTRNVNLKQVSVPNKNIPTKLVTSCWKSDKDDSSSRLIVRLPVPYKLPPQPYSPEDVPWSWDRQYTQKDEYGRVWP